LQRLFGSARFETSDGYGTQLRYSATVLSYGTQLRYSATVFSYGTQLRYSALLIISTAACSAANVYGHSHLPQVFTDSHTYRKYLQIVTLTASVYRQSHLPEVSTDSHIYSKCLQTVTFTASVYRQSHLQQVSTDSHTYRKCLQTVTLTASVYRQSHLQFTEVIQVAESASGECRQLIVCQNAARKQTGMRLASRDGECSGLGVVTVSVRVWVS